MKRIISYGLLLALFPLFPAGCLEDNSSLADKKIDEIIIDASGIPEKIYVGYMEEFTIAPVVTRNGVADDNLEYEWTINTFPNNTKEWDVVGADMVFDGVLSNQIISTYPYKMKLTVTDPKTGIIYLHDWDIYVASAFRDGIVVSHTRDGATSDFTLIMNDQITANWSGPEKVVGDILTSVSGSPFQGLMNTIAYFPTNYQRMEQMWAVDQDNRMTTFDCEDYSVSGTMDGLFIYSGPGFGIHGFAKGNQSFLMKGSDGLYKQSLVGPGAPFGLPVIPHSVSEPHNGVLAADHRINRHPGVIWYDKEKGKFCWHYNDAFPGFNYGEYEDDDMDGALPFNAGRHPGKSAVAGGTTFDVNTQAMLMKDDATGEYEICFFDKHKNAVYDNSGNIAEPEVQPRAKDLIRIPASATAMFDNAVGFVFARAQPILYVLRQDGVYSVAIGTNPATVKPEADFKAPAGETITKAMLFEQGRYMVNNEDYAFDPMGARYPPLPLNLKALLVVTSKGANAGKLYLLPMKDLGTGNFDMQKKMEWEGFGRILDITMQGY